MLPVDGGGRLRRYVAAELGKNDELRSISALCRKAGLNRNTLYDWFTGEAVPSPGGFARLAEALGIGVGDLYAVYDGRADIPTTTDAVLNDLARDIRSNTEAVDRLVDLLEGVADHAIAEEISRVLVARRKKDRRVRAVPVGEP